MSKDTDPRKPKRTRVSKKPSADSAEKNAKKRAAWKALPNSQRVFVDEYSVDLDTRRAAAVAGFGYGHARDLMMEPRMKAAINETLALRSEQAGVRAEDILRDLAIVRDKCMGRLPVPVTTTRVIGRGKKRREEQEVREAFEWDAAGANKALENLGRHKKLFTDVVEARSHEEALGELLAQSEKLGFKVTFIGGLPVMLEPPRKTKKAA